LEIEKMLAKFEPRIDPTNRPETKSGRKNNETEERAPHPEFDLRTETYKLFGVGVTQIPGLGETPCLFSVR